MNEWLCDMQHSTICQRNQSNKLKSIAALHATHMKTSSLDLTLKLRFLVSISVNTGCVICAYNDFVKASVIGLNMALQVKCYENPRWEKVTLHFCHQQFIQKMAVLWLSIFVKTFPIGWMVNGRKQRCSELLYSFHVTQHLKTILLI